MKQSAAYLAEKDYVLNLFRDKFRESETTNTMTAAEKQQLQALLEKAKALIAQREILKKLWSVNMHLKQP